MIKSRMGPAAGCFHHNKFMSSCRIARVPEVILLTNPVRSYKSVLKFAAEVDRPQPVGSYIILVRDICPRIQGYRAGLPSSLSGALYRRRKTHKQQQTAKEAHVAKNAFHWPSRLTNSSTLSFSMTGQFLSWVSWQIYCFT